MNYVRQFFASTLFFATLGMAIPLKAQTIQAVNVEGFRALPQEQSNWCWAASIQAVFLTKGLEISQNTIVSTAYGAPINRTAPGFDGTVKLLNSLVVDVNGGRWRVNAGAGATFPEGHWLLARLQSNEPVIIWFHDPYENHSIIINGGTYYSDGFGQILGWRSITAYDPYLDRNMTIDASNIPRFVYGTFEVDVQSLE